MGADVAESLQHMGFGPARTTLLTRFERNPSPGRRCVRSASEKVGCAEVGEMLFREKGELR
jgi:hypothetical protein